MYEDLSGKTFGRLTVIRYAGSQNQSRIWECLCKCGKKTRLATKVINSGNTRSCGCLKIECNIKNATRHGAITKTSSELHKKCYRTWQSIKARCLRTTFIFYKYYGGSGITVCKRWEKSFTNFYEDMGIPPTYGHSIERIDNNKGYSKSNCKWILRKHQARNKRNTHWLTIGNKTKPICVWAEETGIHWNTIKARVYRGWTGKELLKPAIKTTYRF